jgi:hypothetical protein
MSSRAQTGKQVYELTLDDLARFPVWEFRLDAEGHSGQDESTVRPHLESGPLNPAERMFVVRAVFTLADGSRMTGYLTPPVRGYEGPGTLQPIIVTAGGQIRFWCGTAVPDAKRLAQSYQLLGKDPKHVFPVKFESEVELIGGPAQGCMPGNWRLPPNTCANSAESTAAASRSSSCATSRDQASSCGAATGVGSTGECSAPCTWRVCGPVSASPGSSRTNALSNWKFSTGVSAQI